MLIANTDITINITNNIRHIKSHKCEAGIVQALDAGMLLLGPWSNTVQ